MNFLEQIAAEWYNFNGYFVSTNVNFGPRPRGGYTGEIDVLALKPPSRELVHLEMSSDADRWEERRARFERKFRDAAEWYEKLSGFAPEHIEKIAVVSLNLSTAGMEFVEGVTLKSVPEFVGEIMIALEGRGPASAAVPERFGLIRTLQFAELARKMIERKSRDVLTRAESPHAGLPPLEYPEPLPKL
jgi:hypothetical protein